VSREELLSHCTFFRITATHSHCLADHTHLPDKGKNYAQLLLYCHMLTKDAAHDTVHSTFFGRLALLFNRFNKPQNPPGQPRLASSDITAGNARKARTILHCIEYCIVKINCRDPHFDFLSHRHHATRKFTVVNILPCPLLFCCTISSDHLDSDPLI